MKLLRDVGGASCTGPLRQGLANIAKIISFHEALREPAHSRLSQRLSCARVPPQFSENRSENEGANENLSCQALQTPLFPESLA